MLRRSRSLSAVLKLIRQFFNLFFVFIEDTAIDTDIRQRPEQSTCNTPEEDSITDAAKRQVCPEISPSQKSQRDEKKSCIVANAPERGEPCVTYREKHPFLTRSKINSRLFHNCSLRSGLDYLGKSVIVKETVPPKVSQKVVKALVVPASRQSQIANRKFRVCLSTNMKTLTRTSLRDLLISPRLIPAQI